MEPGQSPLPPAPARRHLPGSVCRTGKPLLGAPQGASGDWFPAQSLHRCGHNGPGSGRKATSVFLSAGLQVRPEGSNECKAVRKLSPGRSWTAHGHVRPGMCPQFARSRSEQNSTAIIGPDLVLIRSICGLGSGVELRPGHVSVVCCPETAACPMGCDFGSRNWLLSPGRYTPSHAYFPAGGRCPLPRGARFVPRSL